ncbi:hypothetical protein LWI29_003068 [Acer saccharum]|uniref:Uncharacterized protein n=1 Tax=Acer saccharum TaxID=4024 RepID=A0AA39SI32_ACESA|nr:hypothetical protein LWI29_003068 [Acer saccharum]
MATDIGGSGGGGCCGYLFQVISGRCPQQHFNRIPFFGFGLHCICAGGVPYGDQLTLLFIIISELFGLKYYLTLFDCGQLASPLGSHVPSVVVVGKLYDKEAFKQLAEKEMTRAMVKELTCIGKQCYKLSFLVLAGVNIFGALVTFILVMRTRKYYSGDIYKRFKDEMAAVADSKQIAGK